MRLVVDWDGTVTERDTLHMVLERFGDLRVFERTEARLDHGLGLNEVIAREMRTIGAPVDEVVAWLLEHVRLRPGFARIVAARDPLVVSAGFHELIGPILERERIEATVVANRLEPRPSGWVAVFRSEEPCEVCGEPCKRNAVDGIGPFAYAGDGASDRCVALLAARVFARDGLAAYLARLGVPFEPLVDFDDLERRLAA
jgi:2-hydroxy-3-keto-5-methylthiopentenyl-1-phosphate phosphatase